MADGVSILTNLSKVGAVSRAVQNQQSNAQAQEESARKIAQPEDPESVLLKKIDPTEKTRVRERKERARDRREKARKKSSRRGAGGGALGSTVDLKA